VDPAIARALEAALGQRVRRVEALAGGVTTAQIATLADGGRVFVKSAPAHPSGWATAEARGLAWLAAAGALRVPQVLAAHDGPAGFLALEWIASAPPAHDHDEQLGRGLARVHRAGAATFGLDADNYLAGLPQANPRCATIADLWGAHRLAPMLHRLHGRAPVALVRGVERVLDRLPELVGPPEPPARVHGDLWAGNAITDEHGAPVLIDPAAYGGHREIDLAMMRLFGGFGPRVFAAYAAEHPLAAGHEARVALWQLYPLLAHAVLFGGGYAAQAARAVASLA
jgi:fructosamine-3-kinase